MTKEIDLPVDSHQFSQPLPKFMHRCAERDGKKLKVKEISIARHCMEDETTRISGVNPKTLKQQETMEKFCCSTAPKNQHTPPKKIGTEKLSFIYLSLFILTNFILYTCSFSSSNTSPLFLSWFSFPPTPTFYHTK